MEECQKTLDAVKSVVLMSDYMHIKRMLTSGCPCELNFEESTKGKLKRMGRGNQKGFAQHSDQVAKSTNKEERKSHVFSFAQIGVLFGT